MIFNVGVAQLKRVSVLTTQNVKLIIQNLYYVRASILPNLPVTFLEIVITNVFDNKEFKTNKNILLVLVKKQNSSSKK